MSGHAHVGWPGVGILGKAKHGKDTLAAQLVANCGYTRRALADALKEKVGNLAIRCGENDKARQWVEERKGTDSVRGALQNVGVMMREHVDIDFWVGEVFRWYYAQGEEDIRPLVIPDVRFPNEVMALKANNFITVRVFRPDFDNGLTDEQKAHISETALDDYVADYTLINDADPEELMAQFVAAIVPKLLRESGLLLAGAIEGTKLYTRA